MTRDTDGTLMYAWAALACCILAVCMAWAARYLDTTRDETAAYRVDGRTMTIYLDRLAEPITVYQSGEVAP